MSLLLPSQGRYVMQVSFSRVLPSMINVLDVRVWPVRTNLEDQ